MPITTEGFRDALRHLAAGVTIVTVKAGEKKHGLTVSAFVSISAEPPLVAVVIDRRHTAHTLLEHEGAVFAVNILRQEQAELSNRFAWVKDQDRFSEGAWTTAVTGAPVLADASVWLDCTIHSRTPTGSHTIVVGAIEAGEVPRPEEPPLVYWNRGYRKLDLGEKPIPSPLDLLG